MRNGAVRHRQHTVAQREWDHSGISQWCGGDMRGLRRLTRASTGTTTKNRVALFVRSHRGGDTIIYRCIHAAFRHHTLSHRDDRAQRGEYTVLLCVAS